MNLERIVLSSTLLASLVSCNEKAKVNTKPANNEKPNILFILADDQRYGTINVLGNDEIITPNLDRLAKNGTSFTHAYIMGASSAAVCMPSRAMLVSGRNLFEIDGEGNEIPKNHITMGEHLLKNGYNCFSTGKWHNGTDGFVRSFNAGDEIFMGGMCDPWNVPAYHFDSTGKYEAKLPFIKNPHGGNTISYKNADHIEAGKHATELFTDAAIDYLKNYDSDKPFYMYVSYTTPHDPRSMPQKYLDMYDTANINLPANFLGQHPFDNGELQIRDELLAGFPRKPSEIKMHLQDYYAMITQVDENVGRIIKTLEEKGELENTIIVYSADNGLAVGQHGLMGKQSLYEHSIKVPLIISGMNIPKQKTHDAFCYLFDIYPALCELVSVEIPESVTGKSFVKCLLEDEPSHREIMYHGYYDRQRALRKENYKLIEYMVNGTRTTQLFDVEKDPLEMKDLSKDKEYMEKLIRMKKLMIEESREQHDVNTIWVKQL